MAFYGLGTKPILDHLRELIPDVSQVWYADDATGAGRLAPLKQWWDTIQSEGVRYGYFVKAKKSWIILKDHTKYEECEQLFASSPINITIEGKRHLGAAIGSDNFKNEYINNKVDQWVKNIVKLSEIAQSHPHAAYAGFIHGEQHKFTYFMRTIANISENLQPLDDAIENIFLPALFGTNISQNDRTIISLPVKDGGLGVRKVSQNADSSYEVSVKVTRPLTRKILQQASDLPNPDVVKNVRSKVISDYKSKEREKYDIIKVSQEASMVRTIEQLSEPGASSWLSALPLESQGFNLTKAEFQDALAIRYMKSPKNLPSHCPCGAPYNITHALNCHRGGFVNARHDTIRDVECALLKSVVNDVECEAPLQIVTNRINYPKSAILDNGARLDVRARGFWREGQNAFFDVRVTNADSGSQISTTVKSVLRKHEQEKKREYNRRVMEVEHGTFTPLIFTTTGVMGPECSTYHKALAEKISKKKGERYDEIMRYLRVKFSFLAMKATLLCLRGSRSISKPNIDRDYGMALIELGL